MTAIPPSFLQVVLTRATRAVEAVDRLIWKPMADLPIEALPPTDAPLAIGEARRSVPQRVALPDFWGRLHQYRWFRVEWSGVSMDSRVWLCWRAESQALAWWGDLPFWGFDHNHRHCRLPAAAGEFWLESVCVTSMNAPWTPLSDRGTRVDGAMLCQRDDQAWRARCQLKLLTELAFSERMKLHPRLGDGVRWIGYQEEIAIVPPLYRRVLTLLDEAITTWQQQGIGALAEALDEGLKSLRSDPYFGVVCTLIGHAHVDLVWLWPERVGELKTRHSLATANRLMEEYPEFRMLHTQAAAYRSLAREAPELWGALRQRRAEGKLDTICAVEVEGDTLLPCGEAMLRNFALGQAYAEHFEGKASRVLWIPDVFGYSGCLPQLMRGFGVDYFFTTKLSWNTINRFPHSSFIWRGTDGSEVLAHLTQETGYNGQVRVDEIRAGADSYRQSGVHDEFLFPAGNGDGGGGPTLEMCERARIAADLAGVARVRWDTATAFFDRLAAYRAKLPTYEGELYFEGHRGTYTTHSDIKGLYRAMERALQSLEAVHCVRRQGPILEEAWQRLSFAQFHDYLPGSSIPPVYREARAELRHWVAVLAEHGEAALQSVEGSEGGAEPLACCFNPLPMTRTHFLEDGSCLELPPLAAVPKSAARSPLAAPAVAGDFRLANDRLEAEFDRQGNLVRLVTDGVDAGLSAPAGLWLFTDVPAQFPSWDLDCAAARTGRAVVAPSKIESRMESDGSAALGVTYTLGAQSSGVLTYRLAPGSRVLEIELGLDWGDPQTLLKYRVPTLHRGTNARFGAPFGSLLRPQRPGEPRAEAMWEVPGSRWAMVQDDAAQEGVFLVSEAKFGFAAREGVLDLSLIRSPLHTGSEGEEHHWIFPTGAQQEPCTEVYTDLGKHRLRWAVGYYTSDLKRTEHPAALADVLYTPVIHYLGQPCGAGLLGFEGGESLIPSWAQPLPGGDWVLRLQEVMGRRGVVRLNLADGVRAARCNFSGVPSAGAVETAGFAFRPYEIVSLRISGSPGRVM